MWVCQDGRKIRLLLVGEVAKEVKEDFEGYMLAVGPVKVVLQNKTCCITK